jgi:hypothetical protein
MLPGDPLRVYNSVKTSDSPPTATPAKEPTAPQQDPTAVKPQEGNPFSGD